MTADAIQPMTAMTPLLVPAGSPLVSGKMYLRLYHGHIDPSQDMEDWGFTGPVFGPLSRYVHTYCCTFRLCSDEVRDVLWLPRHEDPIVWDGSYYGDLEVFVAGEGERA